MIVDFNYRTESLQDVMAYKLKYPDLFFDINNKFTVPVNVDNYSDIPSIKKKLQDIKAPLISITIHELKQNNEA